MFLLMDRNGRTRRSGGMNTRTALLVWLALSVSWCIAAPERWEGYKRRAAGS